MGKATSRHAHGRSEVWERRALVEAIEAERRRLGERLRAVRNKAGFTQEEAAERAGVHPKHVVRIEGGSANVTIATLVGLSVAYGTPLRELFRGRSARRG